MQFYSKEPQVISLWRVFKTHISNTTLSSSRLANACGQVTFHPSHIIATTIIRIPAHNRVINETWELTTLTVVVLRVWKQKYSLVPAPQPAVVQTFNRYLKGVKPYMKIKQLNWTKMLSYFITTSQNRTAYKSH